MINPKRKLDMQTLARCINAGVIVLLETQTNYLSCAHDKVTTAENPSTRYKLAEVISNLS